MSCIYLDKDHYQFIADQLSRIAWGDRYSVPFHETLKYLGGADYKETESKIVWFITMLQCWNSRAYFDRYPELKRDDRPRYIDKANPTETLLPHALYKALQCVRYQCSDAHDWDTALDRDLLETVLKDLAVYIITTSPDYESAKWCIG